jgi:hypothetical protein
MNWVIDGDGGPRRHGRMNLTRLTHVMGAVCSETQGMPPPQTEISPLSGSWYDPTHSGEGYIVQILAEGQALVYWFSFDAEGNRRWFYNTGELDGNRLVFDVLYTTAGGIFGAGFDPDAVELAVWGSLELELTCETGTARFTPSEPGFPAGELQLVHLSFLDGLDCGD